MIKPKNTKFFPSFKNFVSFLLHTHVNLLTSPTSHFTHFQDYIARELLYFSSTYFQIFLSNMGLFPFHQPKHVFRFDLSLSLFLRSGIQLRFTASMLVPLFIASQIRYHLCQIRYHQCEAKMKRSQISVRRKISGLLCVKSTSFSFLFFSRSGI